MSNAQRTVQERSQLLLDEVYASAFQKKGTKTARIRQEVITHSFYPAMKPGNSLSKTLFGQAEFGAEEQEFVSPVQNRVAFLNVPEGATEAQINAHLVTANTAKAVIYEIRSSQPILSEEQVQAIQRKLTTKEVIADRQAMRYSEGTEIEGVDVSGQLVIDQNGKVQYRGTYYWDSPKEDIDLRTADPADTFITEAIEAELSGGAINVSAEVPAVAASPNAMQEA